MKKQLIFLSILCLPFSFNYGQTLKTMASDYNGGKITYQYYEDSKTSEFIKQGLFKFNKLLKNENGGGTYNETITGAFKNGFKDGVWTFSIIKLDFPNNDGSYTTATTNLIQTFKEGVANGEWKLNSTYKSRNKLYRNGGYIWSAFGKVYTEFASTIFTNGYATGVTTYKDSESSTSKTITLNKDGFLIGPYIFQGNYENSEIIFNGEGIVTKFVAKNSSGNVTSKLDFDEELISTVQKYVKGEITNEQLRQTYIKVDTIKATNYVDFGNIFEHDYFFLPDLKGDKVNNTYGRYILAERIKLIDLKTNDLYINARKDLNPNYYDDLLKEYSSEMSESDILKVNNEKKVLENIVLYKNKFGENCQKMIDKLSVYKKPKATKEISLLALKSMSEELDKIETFHSDIKQRTNSEIDKMNGAIEAATNFNVEDFFTFNYKESYEISEESLSSIDKTYVPLANNITSTMNKAENADRLTSELKDNYGLSNNATMNSMITGSLTKEQKILFEVYNEIIASLKQELQISKDSNTANPILDNIILVTKKTIKLKSSDLKELLKSIKKTKSIEEKIILIEN